MPYHIISYHNIASHITAGKVCEASPAQRRGVLGEGLYVQREAIRVKDVVGTELFHEVHALVKVHLVVLFPIVVELKAL